MIYTWDETVVILFVEVGAYDGLYVGEVLPSEQILHDNCDSRLLPSQRYANIKPTTLTVHSQIVFCNCPSTAENVKEVCTKDIWGKHTSFRLIMYLIAETKQFRENKFLRNLVL